ncbi:GNAT family N-acetyltransferase [Gryllotalpicola daejeonensis]|uniref:GNAT family N-acetyltransferase n=1 Tax=Gryllotalpicola daejeonensis TaxID=993087 RepID=A0ABP7ZDN5_9MICO
MTNPDNDSPVQLGDAVLRRARPGDETGILACIQALADYEREPDAVTNTPEALAATLFGESPSVFAHVVEKGGDIVAIAIWFLNYSTWNGTNGIYLEDLFVKESERRNGFGRALLQRLAQIAVARGYGRFEWSVLDWNAPSIAFYRSIGAVGMEEWTVQRVTGDALTALAAGR